MTGYLGGALRSRRLRDRLAIAGITICTLLVLVIASAYRSVSQTAGSYAGQTGADLWVAAPGTDNLIRGSFASLLPIEYADSLRQIPGVVAADPVLKVFLTVSSLGPRARRQATLLSIGYRAPGGLGGPPTLAVGREPRGRREVALDRAAAFRLKVRVGDTVGIAGRKVAVVGLTSGTNILATQFLFVDIAASAIATDTRGKASFVVLRVMSGKDPAEVIEAIGTRFPDLMALGQPAFIASNRREITAGILPIMGLIGGLGIAAAAVLVGLLVNGAVEDRRSDIAVLFALGAAVSTVTMAMLGQALRQAAIGSLLGVVASAATAACLDRWLPIIPMQVDRLDVAVVVGAFCAASTLGAAVPILSLQRLDPMEAFRA